MSGSTRRLIERILAGTHRPRRRRRIDPLELKGGARVL